MDHAEQVDLNSLGPSFQGRLQKGGQGTGNRSGTDQYVHGSAEDHPDTINGKRQLLGIGYVGTNAKGICSGLFDFDMR
jgi:hypothetical protein